LKMVSDEEHFDLS